MQRYVSIGLVQVGTQPLDVAANRSIVESLVKQAFRAGAQIVILPELATTGYSSDEVQLRSAAEPLDGPTTSSWRNLAAEHGGFIAGGFCEAHEAEIFNTAVIVGPEGVILHYRKLHLFAEENGAFSKGDLGLPIVQTDLGVLGLCVCYDLRFVEVARAVALQGAELLCVPTAWLAGFDSHSHSHLTDACPQAQGAILQANLNQIYIACASQVGNPAGFRFLGSSIVAGPYGDVIAGPLSDSDDEVAVVEADLGAVERAQHRGLLINPRKDRRTDVYGIAVDGKIL